MQYSMEQEGVLTAVMERFEKHRLPRILDIKEKVEQGGKLSDPDIDFLEEVLTDTQRYKQFVDKHPEFQELYTRVVHLYERLTDQALENEKNSG